MTCDKSKYPHPFDGALNHALLHYLEIENFKRFGDKQRIELDHPAVLIGPNNCGKTSAIQALAL